MKSGFKDSTEIKNKSHAVKNPWSFVAPEYDERSSCFVNAGTHYGVGHNQPVGHSGNPKQNVPCLPRGRVNTLKVDESG